MQIAHIRKLVKQRPFYPVELLSDGGEKVVIIHPEAVLFGRDTIFVIGPGDMPDWIEARNVNKVRVLKRRRPVC